MGGSRLGGHIEKVPTTQSLVAIYRCKCYYEVNEDILYPEYICKGLVIIESTE